ncbi:TonB-dependent receptor plug domain-containing protein [Variovorax sp. RKNM96]|uniref:TonB-dependent receptor n=1 Tax=Variovorax sp. RKNM96 TaxID=2681552 RepID=UPI00197D03DB|nr:TonB-dependent receptor [Variovorax sp. RKNM96]QSI33298.1 TonB-dependent receptor plug domain-containing protein [Variovorax sp. RKNM96]
MPKLATAPHQIWLGIFFGSAAACAQQSHLPEIEVRGPRDASVGNADSASEGAAERESFQTRPKLRPGDIVEAVPGVVATQHSGDGKANQYFLRGFNLDHGTDFAVTVDGMPVNMPTHGHGEGYADLNFLIPELVSGVRYRKGPYFAEGGDFSLAGSASLDYFSVLDAPFAELTLGTNNFRRLLAAGSQTRQDQTWLGAIEIEGNDGPWDVAENLRKVSAVVRYSQGSPTHGFSITGMAYKSRWTSTDQVPERLIDSGQLSRFGSLNPTDGGNTQRMSLSGKWFDKGPEGETTISAYAIDYRFDLFSDFTYFLSNPVNGDQFEQTDRRRIFGAQAARTMPTKFGGLDGILSFGASWRGDRISEVGLYNTQARERLSTVRNDKVSQDLFSVYGQQLVYFTDRLRGYVGVRGDMLRYRVDGREPTYGAVNSGKGHDAIASPKAGLAFALTPQHEFYLNAGVGFHSNDVRGATIAIDPTNGAAADCVPALVKGRGAELGWRFQPDENFTATVALWQLQLDSELVYVGDAGTTEPGRASSRRGIEATMRWKLNRAWRAELDGAVSRARFRGLAPEGEGNHVDNAVERVFAAGLTYIDGPLTTSLRLRYLGPRALDTTNTIRSRSATLLNFGARYAVNKNLTLGLDVFNLAGKKGNDIEYAYASCSAGEVVSGSCNGGVNDRHVHPMEPRSARVSARWTF